jgi:ornithine cyclodeaminase/alanine dehydrogenase-like protein (mu-crystallin family)
VANNRTGVEAVKETLWYLSRADVERVGLPMTDVIEAVERSFVEKGVGKTQMPPKLGIHPSTDGFSHAMPAYVPALRAAGLKWVSAFPENKARGLPYITGLIVLNDPETGFPTAVMDCTWITAVRTAAATAVAARYLARPDSRTVGIVACGVQGRTNLEALSCVFDIDSVRAYDHRIENAERYSDEMSSRLKLPVEPVERLEDAVSGLDLVVTSGPIHKHPEPSIPSGWLAPGAFACPLDFDSYWTGDAMREADKFATDDTAQLEAIRSTGYFQDTPAPYADLGEIVSGRKPGREHPEERIISMNLGLAIEDMATGVQVLERARELGVGTRLPL